MAFEQPPAREPIADKQGRPGHSWFNWFTRQASDTKSALSDIATILADIVDILSRLDASEADILSVDASISALDSSISKAVTASNDAILQPVNDPGSDSRQGTLVGEMRMYGGSTAPAGWFICDGSAVSRTVYSRLFDVLGTSYGVGDGSTTFNIPDFRDRVAYGKSGTVSLGSVVGANEIDLEHDHDEGTLAADSAGAHDHGGATGGPAGTTNKLGGAGAAADTTHTHSISSDGAHTHTVTGTTAVALDTNQDIRQESLGVNFIIKW